MLRSEVTAGNTTSGIWDHASGTRIWRQWRRNAIGDALGFGEFGEGREQRDGERGRGF
jgi:hypothetical protein